MRLVAWLCVAAYGLTNTHVNLALAQWAAPRAEVALATTDEPDSSKPRCKHCARQTKPAPQSPAAPCSDDSGGPCNAPLCPCGGHECPVPGGCAMCSVAKTPCVSDGLPWAPWLPSLDTLTVDEATSYVPPFCHGLMRPPRA